MGPGAEYSNGRIGGCKGNLWGFGSLNNNTGPLVCFVVVGYAGMRFEFADMCCLSWVMSCMDVAVCYAEEILVLVVGEIVRF